MSGRRVVSLEWRAVESMTGVGKAGVPVPAPLLVLVLVLVERGETGVEKHVAERATGRTLLLVSCMSCMS